MGGLLGWFSSRDRELVERLRVLAERDFLTGLPNTRAFEAAIARRLEAGTPFALLLGDMDGLKAINDSQGHAEGNDALRRLALMLGSSLRPEDEVARVGGDEFAVITVLARNDEAAALAAKLEAAMARQESRITFGWAVYPADGENALSLYRAADERLYARKLVRGERPLPHVAACLRLVGAAGLRPAKPPRLGASGGSCRRIRRGSDARASARSPGTWAGASGRRRARRGRPSSRPW